MSAVMISARDGGRRGQATKIGAFDFLKSRLRAIACAGRQERSSGRICSARISYRELVGDAPRD
jgi:hypothetical protein